MHTPGFPSINFFGNVGVIRTRPGYASSTTYSLDNGDIPKILGIIAGDGTIFVVVRAGVNKYGTTGIPNDLLLNM